VNDCIELDKNIGCQILSFIPQGNQQQFSLVNWLMFNDTQMKKQMKTAVDCHLLNNTQDEHLIERDC